MSNRTTNTYYGNHEPYLEPEPRKPWGRGLLVALGVVVAGVAILDAAPPMEFSAARTSVTDATDAVVEFLVGAEPDEENAYEFATSESPASLQAGDSLAVPCSDAAPHGGPCMVLTLVETAPSVICDNGTGDRTPHAVLSVIASMPDDADPDFPSPFRAGQWSVAPARDLLGEFRSIEEPVTHCGGDDSYLHLAALGPGTWASGNVWLPMPEGPAHVDNGVPNQPIFSVLVYDPEGV